MKSNLTAAALAVLAICTAALVVHPASVVAQQPSTAMPSNQMMEQHHVMMQGQSDVATPTMPGQDAFGAIQEIVRMLEADPNTDWSKSTLKRCASILST